MHYFYGYESLSQHSRSFTSFHIMIVLAFEMVHKRHFYFI